MSNNRREGSIEDYLLLPPPPLPFFPQEERNLARGLWTVRFLICCSLIGEMRTSSGKLYVRLKEGIGHVSVDKKERKEKKFSIFWREGGEEEEEEEFVYTEHYEIASF